MCCQLHAVDCPAVTKLLYCNSSRISYYTGCSATSRWTEITISQVCLVGSDADRYVQGLWTTNQNKGKNNKLYTGIIMGASAPDKRSRRFCKTPPQQGQNLHIYHFERSSFPRAIFPWVAITAVQCTRSRAFPLIVPFETMALARQWVHVPLVHGPLALLALKQLWEQHCMYTVKKHWTCIKQQGWAKPRVMMGHGIQEQCQVRYIPGHRPRHCMHAQLPHRGGFPIKVLGYPPH